MWCCFRLSTYLCGEGSSIPGGVEEPTFLAGLRSSPVKKRQRLGRMCGCEKELMWKTKWPLSVLTLSSGALAFVDLLKVHKNENSFGFDFEICTFS